MTHMNELIPLLGLLLLGGMAAYLLILIINQLRQGAAVRAYQQAESEEVRLRIQRHLDNLEHDRMTKRSAWEGIRKFVVEDKVEEAKGVCSFYLAPHDRQPLPGYLPGQFLTFQLNIQGQRKPVIRCYSLSDAPGHPERYRVTIKHVPPPRDQPEAPWGLSSSYFHEQVNKGDVLDLKAPGGNFYLDTSHDGPVVLVGGGIGLTPVLSMLNYLAETHSHREVWFFLGVVNGKDHVMKEHLNELNKRLNIHVRVCYSHPLDTDELGKDYDVKGWVGVDLFKQELKVNNFDFYICGPPPMMNMITADLAAWGVPEGHIHFEAFGPATVKKPGQEKPKENVEVHFSRSNKTVVWDGQQENLLDFALEHDIPMDFGCRAGTNCGSCTTAIHKGEVEYVGDPNISGVESGACLTCCSVPKGPISLDA